jgi:transposase-like protein
MANTIRDPNREKVWRQTVARHAKSGLPVRQFCRRDGLHESTFHFWRRTIQERRNQAPPRTNSAVTPVPRPPIPRPLRFAERTRPHVTPWPTTDMIAMF